MSPRRSETTLARVDLLDRGVDHAALNCMTVCQLVQPFLTDVHARVGVIDCEDVNGGPVVANLPASAAVGRVPTCSILCASAIRVDGQEVERRRTSDSLSTAKVLGRQRAESRVSCV